MRQVLPFLLMLTVAACGPGLRWDKPGATDQMVAADVQNCRLAAQVEANRYWPMTPLGWGWGFGRRSGLGWGMRLDDDRFYTENRLTNFCMRTKGYQQVPVSSQPQTQAPPQPASPEPPIK